MTRVKATPPALEKRQAPGRIRAILLAVGVHAAFFALIIFGVTWQSQPPPPVQAELWTKLPDAKPSPPPADPAPPPEPAKAEPPKPEPRVEPRPEAKPEPPKPDPKIAEKKEREKRELERREREKVEKQKAEEARRKREQEEAAKKKRDEEKRRKDEEKARREAEAAREATLTARQAEIQSYIDRIKARIRGRANVPDTVTGQPEVQVRIRILPGGDVLDIAIVRSSGNRVYDSAIERAIRSAQPLPVPPADSELFPQFRDLNLNIRHER